MDFKSYCRDVLDFPKQGIIFRDITNLLKNGPVFMMAIDAMALPYKDTMVDAVVAIEARGFIIGAALAYRLGCGLVPVRKQGKLPWQVYQAAYDLEYGQDHLEVHQDAVVPGQRVLIVDDVIATGGTAAAVIRLIKEMRGKIVGAAFLAELTALNGTEKLLGIPVFSLIKY
ncbi:MAG: adenine phosphoribosyltransferase [Dehalococcoidia bacterium]|nr:adenine phosphoribosyltransferase [Dehalococcoidia bacterium]